MMTGWVLRYCCQSPTRGVLYKCGTRCNRNPCVIGESTLQNLLCNHRFPLPTNVGCFLLGSFPIEWLVSNTNDLLILHLHLGEAQRAVTDDDWLGSSILLSISYTRGVVQMWNRVQPETSQYFNCRQFSALSSADRKSVV